jgi:hypothetical protein
VWSWQQPYASIITTVCLIPLFVNRYHNWLFPLVRQFFFVPDQLNKFMNLQMQCFPPAPISFAGIWSKSGDLCLFSLSTATSTFQALWSGTNDSVVCISVCLTPPTPCTFNSWQVILPIQNFMRVHK